MLDRIFVYGTLMPSTGHPMAHRLKSQAVRLGRGVIQAKLFHLGRYPGAVASANPRDRVYGDVFRLISPATSLAWLDEYEDCDPMQPRLKSYNRVIVQVSLMTGKRCSAWVYIYELPVRYTRFLPDGRFRLV